MAASASRPIRRRRRPRATGPTSRATRVAIRADERDQRRHRAPESSRPRPRTSGLGELRTGPTTSSEARGRRPAIRPGDQRRRRAARALHCRAPRAPRRGRGADDVRHRLRHVAERAAGRRRDSVNGVSGPPLPRQARARSAATSAGGPIASSTQRTRSPTSSTGSMPKDRRARRSSTTSRKHAAATTTACSSATATTTRTTARARPASRAILVPTAERDAGDRPVDLSAAVSRRPGADVQLARRAGDDSGRLRQPATSRASSSASDRTCRSNPQPARFRQKYGIRGPFAVYVGRIDENKGCKELFEFFQGYLHGSGRHSCRSS